MLSTFRARFGALSIVAAVSVGMLAVSPAAAAPEDTPAITLANTSFTAGDWGTGLDVSGTGFEPDSVVTIGVLDNSDFTVLGSLEVTADDEGSFADATFVPTGALTVPAHDARVIVQAGDGTTVSNIVALDVTSPRSISANTTTITTADLADPEVGLSIIATGYRASEAVALSAVYNGAPIETITDQADTNGIVRAGIYLDGTAVAGEIVITLAGMVSHVSNSITITVVGDAVGDGDLGLGASGTATATSTKLPVVSG